MRWCSLQTNKHDLQAIMYPIICKYHRLNINNGNKVPVFPGYICNRWQNMIVQPSQTHNHGKIWQQWERCLVWLLDFKNIEGQLSRWIQELSQFDMTVIHRPRKLHTNADALSRIPDSIKYCGNYINNVDVSNFPCYPCTLCSRAHNQWLRFFDDVDYVVPLSIRKI